ncbi:MAG: restriction endonuclease subunit S [Chloroflexi bacterium]|nr:restriction endonuclease subunit S [Chloroflexota bacterium]
MGDVVFSRKGQIEYARLHPAEHKFAMTHTLCIIKPEKSVLDSRYLPHFARSSRFVSYLTRTMNPNLGIPTLGLNIIRSARIDTPDLEEQRRIVAYLDDLQAEVERLKRLQGETAAELDALLPSLLDRAFRGKL